MKLAYYNEHDPKAADWLKRLVDRGMIAPGVVDSRDIQDVCPTELMGYCQVHLFAGIGGWSLALRLAGWPDDRPIWTGSCPCQPFSSAGKKKGKNDERHLWPCFAGLLQICKPSVAVGEQVASPDGREWLAGVSASVEALGYQFAAADLCAAGVGAPHIRQRLYWLAHSPERGLTELRDETQPGSRGYTHGGGEDGGRMAHAEHPPTRAGEPGEQGRAGSGRDRLAIDGETGHGMGNVQQHGLEGHAGDVADGHEPGRVGAREMRPVAAAGSPDGRLGDTASGRNGEEEESGSVGEGEGARGLGGAGGSGVRCGFWDDYRLVECRDPRGGPNLLRRVSSESRAFPLVDGVPRRVELLKGYGNAIVPPLAAEFMQAVMEII